MYKATDTLANLAFKKVKKLKKDTTNGYVSKAEYDAKVLALQTDITTLTQNYAALELRVAALEALNP